MGRGLPVVILTLIFGVLAFGAPACAQSTPSSRFDGWTTAIVSADWRDGHGRPINAFDNARRDLLKAFTAAGLPARTMVDYSLRGDVADPTTPAEAVAGVSAAATRGPAGCLLYFTSHGSPEGMVFGDDPPFPPLAMVGLVRQACGARPTVVIISACYSGIFVDSLKAPNRMVLTAARRDRPSFGCGVSETYPWFDGCVLESLDRTTDFLALAAATRACVTQKETEAGVPAPSEPQLFVGSDMQLRLPLLRFRQAGGAP